MHKVEELKIWQKSIELAKLVYEVVLLLPTDEQYVLTSQIKRSAISISSNIAEGAGRNSIKEFKQFLSIANGSAYELQTQLILTVELDLIPEDNILPIQNLLIEVQKMNFSLQKNLEGKILNTQY
jgi:four helix bundle protein